MAAGTSPGVRIMGMLWVVQYTLMVVVSHQVPGYVKHQDTITYQGKVVQNSVSYISNVACWEADLSLPLASNMLLILLPTTQTNAIQA